MKGRRQGLGRMGEVLARRHLEARGHVVLETNYRCRHGEIDLITESDGVLVFVEVRTRRGGDFGTPEESITSGKRAHLVATAQEYLQSTDAGEVEWRVDLGALEMDARGKLVRLDVIEHAVEL